MMETRLERAVVVVTHDVALELYPRHEYSFRYSDVGDPNVGSVVLKHVHTTDNYNL